MALQLEEPRYDTASYYALAFAYQELFSWIELAKVALRAQEVQISGHGLAREDPLHSAIVLYGVPIKPIIIHLGTIAGASRASPPTILRPHEGDLGFDVVELTNP